MSNGPTPIIEGSPEQALAGMLSAFLACMEFALAKQDAEDREDYWENILDRAGIETGGTRGPIERHLFKDS